MPKTNYLSGNVINVALRQIAYSPPAASYVALYTTSPNANGGGVEVSGGSYGRQAVVWTAPVNGQSSNVGAVVFPVATAVWGTLTSYALLDAAVAGNILYYANLNAPQFVAINSQIQFPIGQLQVLED